MPLPLPPTRATAWSITANLKSVSRETVEHSINTAKEMGWGVQGQIEKGAEGTPHYQLMLTTPQVRFSAVKKVFPTAHIEPARNRRALEAYVHKEDTRVEMLKTVEVSFLTYPQVRKKFFEWLLKEHDVESMTSDHEHRLHLWDDFIGASIREGMEVDLIGMNPQHRGCIAKYWFSYIAWEERRQTDRQTDTPNLLLPTIHTPDAEATHSV